MEPAAPPAVRLDERPKDTRERRGEEREVDLYSAPAEPSMCESEQDQPADCPRHVPPHVRSIRQVCANSDDTYCPRSTECISASATALAHIGCNRDWGCGSWPNTDRGILQLILQPSDPHVQQFLPWRRADSGFR